MKMKIRIHTYVYIYISALLFLIPFQWLLAWITAVCFHEFCHWAAVKLCGGTVYCLSFDIAGVQMECTPLSDIKNLIAVLSGPIGGFILLFLGKWFPEAAVCSWFLSVYNLIPVRPLDGGNAVALLFKRKANFQHIEQVILSLLTIFAVYSSFFLQLGILPMAVVTGIWLRKRKIPCKHSHCRVQ